MLQRGEFEQLSVGELSSVESHLCGVGEMDKVAARGTPDHRPDCDANGGTFEIEDDDVRVSTREARVFDDEPG